MTPPARPVSTSTSVLWLRLRSLRRRLGVDRRDFSIGVTDRVPATDDGAHIGEAAGPIAGDVHSDLKSGYGAPASRASERVHDVWVEHLQPEPLMDVAVRPVGRASETVTVPLADPGAGARHTTESGCLDTHVKCRRTQQFGVAAVACASRRSRRWCPR